MSDNAGTRYATLTSTDQSANIWVVSIITALVSAACFAVRVLSKSRTGFKFGFDDYSLLVGWCLSIVQVALIMKSLTLGLGKDGAVVPVENVKPMEKYFFASVFFGIFSLYSVKISIIILIQRLFKKSMLPVWIIFMVLGISSGITVLAGCSYNYCSNSLARWVIVAVFDILTEVLIILLPVFCIQSIQMSKVSKMKVQASFFSRLSNVLFSSLTIWSLSRLKFSGRPSTTIVLPIVFGQLEVCVSLSIASILPCFRIIFQSSEKVPTGFSNSGGYNSEPKPGIESHGTQSGDSFHLGSVKAQPESGTLPRTKKPDHSPTCSQDMGAPHSSHSECTNRLSYTSVAPSGATRLSQKSLIT
ncbi:ATP-dependent DNA helicase II subunit 2 [Venturia nashicola]|uniref:ATP-dependent DNA helicase II subunit 2 n=1 Tax=Venturia nashicola TaxID=86259 RepID=A0A4Z1PMV7_9PEZI|nr:ATP-dependent DNA helicase II subunit 2 [Venturia nashicola]TLD36498.1 ATP-dependent DNA helicase II subunit 2 [Venturia nashicola]